MHLRETLISKQNFFWPLVFDETNLKSAIFIFTKKNIISCDILCRIYHSSDILRRLEQKPLSDILR